MSKAGEALSNAAQAAVDRHITGAQGQETALRFADKRYTFHDLAALTNRVGNMLKRFSTASGRFLIVAVPESPAYIATILGALKVGAVPVVLASGVDAAMLARARAASKAALLVIHQNHLGALDPGTTVSEEVIVVGQDTGTYKSFVELVREEPSSLSVTRMAAEAPALAWLEGAALKTMAHAELVAALARADVDPPGAPTALAQLRTLSEGGAVSLG